MQPVNTQSRRTFLRNAVAFGAVVGFPTVLPSNVFGKKAPSNRITMGAIGVGNMGTHDLRAFLGASEVQMLAVCDVDKKRAAKGKEHVDAKYQNPNCKVYGDFREITRRPDIDAVVIATPDHWHVIPAIDAAKHGKHVYIEKPLSLTIQEGRVLARTVKRHGVTLQVGSQQRSDSRFRQACELVRNGRLGKLTEVHVGLPGNNRTCLTWKPQPVPPELDYNFWLGQAPLAPYHKMRCHYSFRFIQDYSGGQITNWGAHHLDIVQWALGTDGSGPTEVEGKGVYPRKGLFNTAEDFDVTLTYPEEVRVRCRKGSGIKFIGSAGWVYVDRSKIVAEPVALLQEKLSADSVRLYVSRSHRANFLDCIRTGKETICNAEVGHRSATACHLANIAMLLKRKLKWDPEKEEFKDDRAANAMRYRAAREPWVV